LQNYRPSRLRGLHHKMRYMMWFWPGNQMG
jgi:hypothetical protein